MAEVILDKLILHFAQSNKAEGKSPKTIAWYSEMLYDFTRFVESKGCRGILSKLYRNGKGVCGLRAGKRHVPLHSTGQGESFESLFLLAI